MSNQPKSKPKPIEKNVLVPIFNSDGRYLFFCPGCQASHHINTNRSYSRNCHTLSGTLNKPTIRASILSIGNSKLAIPHCHSFITKGKIKFLEDCTHQLAGKTVVLKPF